MKFRKILLDPSFWILFIVNVLVVVRYLQNPGIFTTLVWLYWSQNVLYGLFNFADIVTSKNVNVKDGVAAIKGSQKEVGTTADPTPKPFKTDKQIASDMAWGFLYIFGFFHFIIAIFLFSMKKTGPFDWGFYKEYLAIFFVSQIAVFIQHKFKNRDKAADVTLMSVLPYLRVVPVHLCILIPAFLPVSNLIVFLVLKVIADMITFVQTANYYKKEDILTTATFMNIDQTISHTDF